MTHNDDQPVGQVLSRREALAFLGVVSAAMLASCAPGASPAEQPTTAAPTQSAPGEAPTPEPATQAVSSAAVQPSPAAVTLPTCVVRPAMTEGPYFVDEKLNRSDIRSDPSDNSVREGAPLKLIFRVSRLDAATCSALSGAVVDIWHCDAQGLYSDVEQQVGKKFLRGYQATDASGLATFTTIYPGWYRGRATHIHFKIRNDPADAGYNRYESSPRVSQGDPAQQAGWDFTSQLFFDEAMNDRVYATQPYAARGSNTTRNAQDGIYRNGGDQLLLQPAPDGDGYTATFDIGLQLA